MIEARQLQKPIHSESWKRFEMLDDLPWKSECINQAEQDLKTAVHYIRFPHAEERFAKAAARAGKRFLCLGAVRRLGKDIPHRVKCIVIPTDVL